MLRQIREIHPTSNASPQWFTALGSRLFFSADDGANGGSSNQELWVSDGTEAGTVLLKDIAIPPWGSYPGQQARAVFRGDVFFSASDGSYQPLWRSDGTAAGTRIVNTAFPTVGVNRLAVVAGRLFAAFGGGAPDSYLYSYDGSSLVPLFKPLQFGMGMGFNPFDLTPFGSVLYFTENYGNELWRTDGTTSVRIEDPSGLVPEDLPRNKQELTAVGSTLFFAAEAGPGGAPSHKQLWKLDPASATTARVATTGTGYLPTELTAAGNRLFFVGDDSHGSELWISDGTSAGTRLVKDINPTADATAPGPRRGPSQLTAVNDTTIVFAASDGVSGEELWISDGTEAGTRRLADLNPGPNDSFPRDLTLYGDTLYFTAQDSSNPRQLWSVDLNTNTPTQLTTSFMLGSGSNFYIEDRSAIGEKNLTLAGQNLFFSAYSRTFSTISGSELWSLKLPSLVSLSLGAKPGFERVQEDGVIPLQVVFQRGGDTTFPLTVGFTVGGSASFGSDYSQIGATSFSASGGSITFAAGQATAIVSLDPTADLLSEGDESITLTLTPPTSADYALAAARSVTATLVDNDVASPAMVRTPLAPAWLNHSQSESRNRHAFAALKADGSVVTWGEAFAGGDSSAVAAQLGSGVTQIFSSLAAFAALKDDGSVVTWGFEPSGGDSSAVAAQLRSGVTQIFSTDYAFAALKSDGSVVTWGQDMWGGNSSAVSSRLRSGVTRIFATGTAFAALKDDGSLVLWGWAGGTVNRSEDWANIVSDVVQVFSSYTHFVALKRDGSVVVWGSGDEAVNAPYGQLAPGVSQIVSTGSDFAALKSDGSVVAWGPTGGGSDSGAVSSQLASGVVDIVATVGAYAALKRDGSVVTWGEERSGGNSSAVSAQLAAGVRQIFANSSAFAALKSDGSVVTWGSTAWGGDSDSVASQLASGVTRVFANEYAFAALKSDGSVVTWGDGTKGGDSGAVSAQLRSGVSQIFSTANAFAAIKNDGSVVTWGQDDYGGDSSAVASRLSGGVVSFADPFADDRLSQSSIVTLTVSPALVMEDGPTNLVFTFTRSQPTSSPLTVKYSVAGSATLSTSLVDTDYTGIPVAGPTKTVTFAAGSTTATVTVDPTADATIELAETVQLTLVPGDGYVIGTSTAVSGTIVDDDSFTTIENQGNTTLQRLVGGRAVVRIGTSRLPVTSAWDAPVGSDTSEWQMLAAETIAGVNRILWRNNSANFLHTWRLDGDWNWTAASGTDGFNTPRAWSLEVDFQVDANRDGIIGTPYTTIESQGNTKLLRRGDGKAFAEYGAGSIQEITSPWDAPTGSESTEWQMLAAETIAGVNRILWRNNSANFLHTWRLDGDWNWTAASGTDGFNTPRAWSLEVDFQVDANRDGIIGTPYTTIESQGNTKLLRRGDGKAFAEYGAGSIQEITSPWDAPTGSESTEWQMLAAETIAGVNRILWRNNSANFLHTWRLDGDWNWTAASGADGFNTPRAWALEVDFQVDANRDGIIGTPYTTIESQGNTKLLRRGDGKAFAEYGAGTLQQITSPWDAPTGSESTEWQMLAAETIAGVNRILWRNNSANFLHIWRLDADWNWTAASGADGFNTPRAWALEVDFQVDANRDGIIGTPYTTIESQGNTKLLRRGDGKAFAEYGAGTRQEITSPWDAPVGSDTSEWQMVAAETIAGVNRILWRNNSANFLHTWRLDGDWNWTAASGADGFNTPRAWALEVDFQVDANRDGFLGAPPSA